MAVKWQQNYQVYRKYIQSIATLYQERSDLRAFTEILLSVLTITMFTLFAIRPTLVTIAGLNTDIRTKNETIAQLDQKIESLVAAQALYEEKRTTIALLASAIPSLPEPEVAIRQIESIASQTGLQLSGIAVGTVDLTKAASEETETLPFTITGTGGYRQMLSFLLQVEKMRRPLAQSQMTMALSGDSSDLNQLTLTIKGVLPFLRTNE